jgi:hypothetical protein
MIAGTIVEDLKIFPLLNERFNDYVHHELDFARHLLPTVALTKDVSYHPNGRPITSEYFNSDGVKVCQIRFEIASNSADNLMTDRKEWLSYVKNDGSLTSEFLIKWQAIDPIKHAALRIGERKKARQWILEDIEIMVAGVLAVALSKTIPEIEALTDNYFIAYQRHMEFFVKKGNAAWLESLQNDDLSAYSSWMLDIPAWGGQNLKTYLIARLSY